VILLPSQYFSRRRYEKYLEGFLHGPAFSQPELFRLRRGGGHRAAAQ